MKANSDLKSHYKGLEYSQIPLLSDSAFGSHLRYRGLETASSGITNFNSRYDWLTPLDGDPLQYHEFQTWLYWRFVSSMRINATAALLYSDMEFDRTFPVVERAWDDIRTKIQDFKDDVVPRFDRLLPLLLNLECYYIPLIRASRTGAITFVGGNRNQWEEWRFEEDKRSWLTELRLELDEVIRWHDVFLRDAAFMDEAESWYLLVRSIPYEERRKLKGSLRLSRDFYEIAEMLRMYLSDVADVEVSKEWEPRGMPSGEYVERRYGVKTVNFGSPELLRPLIRQYGLDPSFRVRWMVEGQTEEGFIQEYSIGLGINLNRYVTFRNFKGDGNFTKRLDVLDQELDAAKADQCFVTLTIDDSPVIRKRIEGLQRKELITLKSVVNLPDFERANFTPLELARVVISWASEPEYEIEFCLGEEDFGKKIEESFKKNPKDVAKSINRVLHDCSIPFPITKGIEWGKRLALYRLRERSEDYSKGVYIEGNLTKIERQTLYVFRASQPYIDFPMSLDNTDLGDWELK